MAGLNKASNLADSLMKTDLIKQFDTDKLWEVLHKNTTDEEIKYIWAMIYKKDREAIVEKLILLGLPKKDNK